MEAHAVLPEYSEADVKVASFAFDNCLAHKDYIHAVQTAVFQENAGLLDDDHKAFQRQSEISSLLIVDNKSFLSQVAESVRQANASVAILFNGDSHRQSITSDIDNASGRGLFFFAQEPLAEELNKQMAANGYDACWRRDSYVTADTHAEARNPGDTYNSVVNEKKLNEAQPSFFDTSNLAMLYAQYHKVAFEYKNKKTIVFDFYNGDKENNAQLHHFLSANKDLIPRNVKLRIHTYTGTSIPVDDDVTGKKELKHIIEHFDEIVGEGDIEEDFQQGYLNLIKRSGCDHAKLNYPTDLLALYMGEKNAEKLAEFKASRNLPVEHPALAELAGVINTTKTLLLGIPDKEAREGFAGSLRNVYWKMAAELKKTENTLKPAQLEKEVPKCHAVKAAKIYTEFLQGFNQIAETNAITEEDKAVKLQAHLSNWQTFHKKFNTDHTLRVLGDVAKGFGISLGFLLLAGAVGGGIGFGVGFAIGGPLGAVAVGTLGAIIGGAIAAGIGALGAALLSGRSIFNKQKERRGAEKAVEESLDLAGDRRLVGLAAG